MFDRRILRMRLPRRTLLLTLSLLSLSVLAGTG